MIYCVRISSPEKSDMINDDPAVIYLKNLSGQVFRMFPNFSAFIIFQNSMHTSSIARLELVFHKCVVQLIRLNHYSGPSMNYISICVGCSSNELGKKFSEIPTLR